MRKREKKDRSREEEREKGRGNERGRKKYREQQSILGVAILTRRKTNKGLQASR